VSTKNIFGSSTESLDMSDRDLINLNKNRKWLNGHLPYLYWSSETYGQGSIYRKLLSFSTLQPLPFSSDHGVTTEPHIEESDWNSGAPIHFTYRSSAVQSRSTSSQRMQIISIEHPWITYRKQSRIAISKRARGAIAFIPHSIATAPIQESLEEYLGLLVKAKSDFGRVTICVGMKDVHAGIIPNLRKFNLPIVSVGHVNNKNFGLNFYRMICNFRFGISNSFGSEVLIGTELGLPFSILGPLPEYIERYLSTIGDRDLNGVPILNRKENYLKHYERFLGPYEQIATSHFDSLRELCGVEISPPVTEYRDLIISNFAHARIELLKKIIRNDAFN